MQNILVPIDFSDTSSAALDQALPLAKMAGATVTLLHVIYKDKLNEALLGLDAIENLSKSMDLAPDPSRFVPVYDLAAIRSAAEAKLVEIAEGVDRADVTINTAIREGRPSTEIIGYASENAIDLIVMGTHGRGPVGRLFLGSVTENVIRGADCPVLAVRK